MTIRHIPFRLLLSPQDFVYQEDVEFYKDHFREYGRIEPIEVHLKYDGEGLYYLLGDGNTRAVTLFQLGKPGIEANVLENRRYNILGRLKKIEAIGIRYRRMGQDKIGYSPFM